MFDFDTPIDRRDTGSYKWDRYCGRDVIPLWVADTDFRTAPAIVEAIQERAAHGVFGYTHPTAELERAVCSSLLAEYGWRVDPEWLVWLPGVVSALNVLCRSVGQCGDDVATLTPVYAPFMTAPALAGRSLVKVPLAEAGGRWYMDLEALEAALTPRTKLLLLCTPHNPVARVWEREELAALMALAARHDLTVGSDDIHAGLVLDEDKRHVPVATLSSDAAARTVTLMSPSKTFNIAGLGCAFAVISNPALRRAFSDAMNGIVPHVNVFGYIAALAAYQHGAEWLDAQLSYLRGNRDLVEKTVASIPGLSMTHVEATYLAWIDARGLGVADPAGLFERAGVGLSDGAEFGAPGYVRLNFGCSRSLLEKALRRLVGLLIQ